MSKLVIVPSAKLAAPDLQADFGAVSSCMIPIDSKPAFEYLSRNFDAAHEILICGNEGLDQIEEYISFHNLEFIKLFNVGETNSLGETIYKGLSQVNLMNIESLIINFGDTYVKDSPSSPNTLFYSNSFDTYRWTTFSFDKNKKIFNVQEKNKFKKHQTEDLANKIIVGQFYIENTVTFYQLLLEALQNEIYEIDPFYHAIQAYFNALPTGLKEIQPVTQWYDFGHLDTFFRTRRKLALKPRYFNSVQIDEERGVLIKKSEDHHKFEKEILWYTKIPKDLQYLTPRIFEYSVKPPEPFVKMEYYGYPPLSDLYLHGRHDVGIWINVFKSLELILNDMSLYTTEDLNCTGENIRNSINEIYLNKTNDRINKISNLSEFTPFFSKEIIINNKSYQGLHSLLKLLPNIISKSGLLELDHFSVIHGDLCLSNILYDRRSGVLRLIDPRGTFGSFDIFGDPKYDLAKLTHSIEGDYDFIVQGLFKLNAKTSFQFELSISQNVIHQEVKEYFKNWLFNRVGEKSYNQIKLIESLLFLSMVPLHKDRLDSQKAFLIKSIIGLCDYLEKN